MLDSPHTVYRYLAGIYMSYLFCIYLKKMFYTGILPATQWCQGAIPVSIWNQTVQTIILQCHTIEIKGLGLGGSFPEMCSTGFSPMQYTTWRGKAISPSSQTSGSSVNSSTQKLHTSFKKCCATERTVKKSSHE